jgi:GT2 family glycosyltransferase
METVRPLFSLERDPVFAAQMIVALEALSLGDVGVRLETIAGQSSAVGAVTARTRFKGDELVFAFGAQAGVARLGGHFPFLAARRDDEALFLLDFDDQLELDAAFYLLGRRASLRMRMVAFQSPDASAFLVRNDGVNTDFARVLGQMKPETSTSLNRLLRDLPAQSVLHQPLFGVAMEVEVAAPLAHGLFVAGWFDDPEGRIQSIHVVDHSLVDPDLKAGWRLFPVLVDAGAGKRSVTRYCAFLPRKPDAPLSVAAPEFRVDLDNGESHLLRAQPTSSSAVHLRDAILNTIVGSGLDLDVLSNVYLPAIGPLQADINGRQAVRRVEDYGRRSSRRASIVVPLYREIGFLRSQLMAFSVDSFIRDHVEVIYVVDDPTIASIVSAYCEGAMFAFTLDIRVAILERNGGYALANNYGVSLAEGEFLALLNSDVIPERPGWLNMIAEKLALLPAFSVVGPRLLYGDGSLQHAGMYFDRLSSGFWQNFHFWKGYSRLYPPALTEREVPAVTGACMVLSREAFVEVGGFTPDYVVGDYEDSDLCLKLRSKGGVCYYAASVELRHYERQSMPQDTAAVDRGSTQYNRALHTLKWDTTIREVMSDDH